MGINNGFIIQHGKSASVTNGSSTRVTLPISFSTIYVSLCCPITTNNSWLNPATHSQTLTAFSVMAITNTGHKAPFYWICAGS